MEVSKNEKNKQLFNVCCEEAYTPDVLKIVICRRDVLQQLVA